MYENGVVALARIIQNKGLFWRSFTMYVYHSSWLHEKVTHNAWSHKYIG